MLHPKKEATKGKKHTNEITTTIPLLESIDITGKTITADAMLTQRKLVKYIAEKRQDHYHFTVKKNQKHLFGDIHLFFKDRTQPDFEHCNPPDHGRMEIRQIGAQPN